MPSTFRVVCISDTHLNRPKVPEGDVLIHAGDFTNRGTIEEIRRFSLWFRALPHAAKIVIAGNHERSLDATQVAQFQPPAEPEHVRQAEDALTGVPRSLIYLRDAEAFLNLEGRRPLHVYGSPWQPAFNDWAFNLPRNGVRLARKWAAIPNGLDILVTHGPPAYVLDRSESGEHVGDELLRDVVERAKPRLHVFGHVHEGYGVVEKRGTIYVNASVCDLNYAAVNDPVVIDL